jgi:hypothetical protein
MPYAWAKYLVYDRILLFILWAVFASGRKYNCSCRKRLIKRGGVYVGIQELNDLVLFVEELSQNDTVRWDVSIENGKWSINDIISHIWLWDKYSLSLMIPLIRHGVTLRFIDQTAINSNAESFARTLQHKGQLIENFIETRRELIIKCKDILHENVKFFVGKKEHNIETYVKKFITTHDKHHMNQIGVFISKSSNSL